MARRSREAAVVFQAAPMNYSGDADFGHLEPRSCGLRHGSEPRQPVWNPKRIVQGGVLTIGKSTASPGSAESSKSAAASSLDSLERCHAGILYNCQRIGSYQQLSYHVWCHAWKCGIYQSTSS
ncbi:unnamed protein product [Urochloa humidicola]